MSLIKGGLPEKQELEVVHKYVDLKMNSGPLAIEYNVHPSTILETLDRYGVTRRTMKDSKGGLSDEQELEVVHEYVDLKMNSMPIARKHGVCKYTILSILDRHGVTRRTIKESKGGLSKRQEAEVVCKYTKLGVSCKHLSQEYGMGSKSTILRLLNRHGVQKRTVRDYQDCLSSEQELEIVHGYTDLKKGTTQLAKECHRSPQLIRRVLHRHGVQVTPMKEVNGGLSNKQELTVCRKYTKLRTSAIQLAKECGVSKQTIYAILRRHGVQLRAKEQYSPIPHTKAA
jgi:hypothetical protein